MSTVQDRTKAAEPAEIPAKPAPRRRKRRRVMLMLAVPLALLAGGTAWWLAGGRYEETDNANYHEARLSIASSLSGRVVASSVEDSKHVRKGDELFRIDAEPYRIALAQADAALANARLGVEQLKVAYGIAVTNRDTAKSEAAYVDSELERQKELARKGVTTSSALDSARHNAQKAHEALSAAIQGVEKARAALGGNPEIAVDDHPTVRAAMAARDQAAYNLSQTVVHAPADGTLYQASSFSTGQFVAAGAPLFALVETGRSWVEANFKETQIGTIAPGQKAEVVFDTFPGRTFHATVAAIGAGTGAEFSLLPAQNATGNWVKVTQRVPIRLELTSEAGQSLLRSGMSATVAVETGKGRTFADLVPQAIAKELGAGKASR